MSSSSVEPAVAQVLLWGGLVSVAFMLCGLGVYAAQGQPHALESVRVVQHRETGRPVDVFTSLADVRRGLSQRPVDALAIATVGLLCLLATPVAGVAVATVCFWRERDRPFGLMSATLLAMLLVGLVLAGGG